MTDIGGIIPDTAKVPVAQELVYPEQTQNGNVSGHGQFNAGTADQQAPFSNGQPEQPKAGVATTKGPRSGIHWGAGAFQPLAFLYTWCQHSECTHACMENSQKGTYMCRAIAGIA